MTVNRREDPLIQRLMQWGEDQEAVRAMLLTSSRANPNADVDLFSDYDVILVVVDILPYFKERSWLEDFGEVLVIYRDPVRSMYGFERSALITQYEDGAKIDFTLWPIHLLQRIIEDRELPPNLDIGYEVLLDKDGVARGLRPPTYSAYIPSPPSEEEYQELIEVFFHEATYVAKNLWRGDLMAAKYNLDHVMKLKKLGRMLEWRIEVDHDWSLMMKNYGRGLRKILDDKTWFELENTYAGPDHEKNWEALLNTITLFRRIAKEVGHRLGYIYLNDLDQRMMDYLHRVRCLNPDAKEFRNR
jgi:aminoglycoside 6-adenylyltransferase